MERGVGVEMNRQKKKIDVDEKERKKRSRAVKVGKRTYTMTSVLLVQLHPCYIFRLVHVHDAMLVLGKGVLT